MTSEIDEFRSSLVAAVQAELERHASAVVAEVDRLRDEGRKERAELWAELSAEIAALKGSVEQSHQRADQVGEKVRLAIEQRLEESERRQTRRVDDVASGIDSMVQAAARPLLQEVRDDQEALVHKVDGLDANLRKFDEQAARMVTYFNEVTQSLEARQDEVIQTMQTDVATQIDALKVLVDENDSTVRRFQNEVGQQVSQKLNDAEDRFNNRLLAAESRMKEDAGQKIAEIDLHVSRVSNSLDETMAVLNDRIAGIDDKFVSTESRLDAVDQKLKGVDERALDELRDKVSAATGEAMLVRIEMERFEKGMGEKTDGLSVRMTEVETALADATMDVSTAVQLDRLEEIERALIEIDPSKFVLKDEVLKNSGSGADAHRDAHGDAASRALGDADAGFPAPGHDVGTG